MRIVFLVSLIVAGGVFADDVTDAIDQAVELYADGQSQQAISQLEFAAQLIRQQRGQGLTAFLPEPLDGWSAEDATSATAGAAMLGGGTTIEREYSKDDGDAEVTIQIITDSPMMSMMMMMFSNPMMAASQGGTLQPINGQQALVTDEQVTIVVSNTYLVQVNGSEASRSELVQYAGAIDFAGLAAFK